MLFTDFEYDNKFLSDFGCIVCNIDGSTGVETEDIGSQLSLNTINRNKKFRIASTEYSEPYTFTFQIAKLSCNSVNINDTLLNEYEISQIVRWLNKQEYHKFKPICQNGEGSNIYYMATFNVKKINIGTITIGLELTLIADASFGYYDDVECDMNLLTTDSEYMLYDQSDEVGYIYPDVQIKCLSAGNITISNTNDTDKVVIKNCVNGEVININGNTKQISSNKSHSTLGNDFNYNFLKVVNKNINGLDERDNIYSSTLPCEIHLKYSPIYKGGII